MPGYTAMTPIALLLALLLTACTTQEALPPPASESSVQQVQSDPETPPTLTVQAGEKQLPLSMRQEYWDGTVTCGEDLLVDLMQNHSVTELPVLASGETLLLAFPADALPDGVRLLTEPRAIDGRTLDSSPRMEGLALDLAADGTATLSLPAPADGAELTGFLLEATWGEDNCWYAFAVLPAPERAERQ